MSGENILLLCYKTILFYFLLVFLLKIMGKREIGNLSTFDVVVFFIISELFSLSLNQPDSSLLHSLIPILIIVILQLLTAFISLKSSKIRKFMEGRPSFIIYHGQVQEKEMKKQRYNYDDLLLQLRLKDIQTPDEVEFAILENNGQLNIITKQDNKFYDPFPLIEDGELNKDTLKRVKLNENDILDIFSKNNYSRIEEISLLLLLNDGYFILSKEESNQKDNIQ